MTAITLRYDDRRVRFEPVQHPAGDYQRVVQEWTGCRWRRVGREFVDDVEVTVGDAAE